MNSTRALAFAALAGAALAVTAHLEAQQPGVVPFVTRAKPAYDDGNVEMLPVQGSVYVVAGSGRTSSCRPIPMACSWSTPASGDVREVLAALKTISDQPIRQIINTSADAHHVAGNEALSVAGRNINAGIGGAGGREPSRLDGAPIIATEMTMHRMAGLRGEPVRAGAMWPQNTFFGPRKDWVWGGEPIELLYKPAAHTDGDLIVWFRKSDVIATGDILDTTSIRPSTWRAADHQGYLNALNDILDIMVPLRGNQGGTLAVPGHGRICNEGDVAEIRDSLTIITDRIRDMVAKKMTLAQVKAAKPSLDYDGIFGDPNAFIEAVLHGSQQGCQAGGPAGQRHAALIVQRRTFGFASPPSTR